MNLFTTAKKSYNEVKKKKTKNKTKQKNNNNNIVVDNALINNGKIARC